MDSLKKDDVRRPFILGVTGGIGSGKSTVCQVIASFGVPVFYADDEGKRILQSDPEAIKEVIEEFGDHSYDESGVLDRTYLASVVFNDEQRLRRLNQIVHPRVRAAFNNFVEENSNSKLVVHESAIIFEAHLDELFDGVVVVDADVDIRLARAIAAGKSEGDVRKRMEQQMPAEELRELADYIVYNNGTFDDLEDEVEVLLRSLLFLPR
ncbi:MAG: dephospho-CoA kinase [Rhodothermales bacterium]|nr:dephospho-CoA kinase [Rhodothermales bacterium]